MLMFFTGFIIYYRRNLFNIVLFLAEFMASQNSINAEAYPDKFRISCRFKDGKEQTVHLPFKIFAPNHKIRIDDLDLLEYRTYHTYCVYGLPTCCKDTGKENLIVRIGSHPDDGTERIYGFTGSYEIDWDVLLHDPGDEDESPFEPCD